MKLLHKGLVRPFLRIAPPYWGNFEKESVKLEMCFSNFTDIFIVLFNFGLHYLMRT